MKKLPTKWSALLRLAVRDAKKCEKDERYRLSMMNWHVPADYEDVCLVCMGGAVMAKSLGANPFHGVLPADYPDDACDALEVIDLLRAGASYLADLAPKAAPVLSFVRKHYNEDRGRAPWHIYLKAADRLERLGL